MTLQGHLVTKLCTRCEQWNNKHVAKIKLRTFEQCICESDIIVYAVRSLKLLTINYIHVNLAEIRPHKDMTIFAYFNYRLSRCSIHNLHIPKELKQQLMHYLVNCSKHSELKGWTVRPTNLIRYTFLQQTKAFENLPISFENIEFYQKYFTRNQILRIMIQYGNFSLLESRHFFKCLTSRTTICTYEVTNL